MKKKRIKLSFKFAQKIYKYVEKLSFGHIIISAYMIERIPNPNNNKRFFLIEGIADPEMFRKQRVAENTDKIILMYTGALDEIYGIKSLVEAFMGIDKNNWELHLYGQGDCCDFIKKVSHFNENIKFFGVIENYLVIEKQLNATILINPRPSNDGYTKFSFPSKIIEYMATGVPVLTTKLPGIPSEYDDYLIYMLDESVKGIKDSIISTVNLGYCALNKKGENAKQFVLKNKNPKIQISKIFTEKNQI